jgi:hypothetical protein
VECSIRENRTWNTNGPEANIFGVEPNYGCCTANLSQGWPKLAAHLWMHLGAGLAAVVYAPSRVATEIGHVPVQVTLETDYPFRERLHFRVEVERQVRFPLLLRIPQWAKGATLLLEGEVRPIPDRGDYYTLERDWQGALEFDLILPMKPRLQERPGGAVAIERGPLVYALQIGEEWRRVHADQPYRELPHADWEVYPTTPWNYALQVCPEMLEQEVRFEEQPLGELVFSPQGAPVRAMVKGRRIPGWELVNGSAGLLPESPVRSEEAMEEVVLIPYGCTNLRIAEFPVLEG